MTSWMLAAPALGQPWTGLADHLWQTTVCVAVAASLAAVVGARRPQLRFWIWFAASIKFLIPFSLLTALGHTLARWILPAVVVPLLPAALNIAGRPFTAWALQTAVATPSAASALEGAAPALACGIWLVGCLAVLASIRARRHRVVAAIAGSRELTDGREFAALQRVLAGTAIGARVTIREASAPFEPGLVGVRRPLLLWPAGLSERLGDAEIEAVVTHELCHARRADNLTARVHMFVETLFWFHPLAWWLGARLVAEREHACDQEVLSRGARAEAYAQSLISVCGFCLRSPLASVAGITGSTLAHRVEAIMTFRSRQPLGAGRRLLLTSVACGVLVGPIAAGIVTAQPAFVASAVPAPMSPRLEAPIDTRLFVPAAPLVTRQAAPRPVAAPAAAPAPRASEHQTLPAPDAAGTIAAADAEFIGSALRAADTPGMTEPQVVRRVLPNYTTEAMRAQVQGSVSVEVVVLPDGSVGRARVAGSLDSQLGLDAEALKAARNWTFVPATIAGQAVEALVSLEMVFRLH